MSMRVNQRAHADWEGPVDAGGGHLSVRSGAFEGTFSLQSRSHEGERQTNPEELIGAAHAGCFSMALSNVLTQAGHPPNRLDTDARVTLEEEGGDFTITGIVLTLRGDVPGVDEQRFLELANEAKVNCPVSKALAGTEITLDAQLGS